MRGQTFFLRRDNNEKAKINWQTLEAFSRTPVQFSTKLVTQHPWGKGIQVWPRPFLREYNYEIAKMNWWNSETFFCRTNGQFHSNLAQIILCWRGFKFVKVKGYTLSLGEIIEEIHWRNLKIFSWITQMKGHALFQGEIITKWRKYIDKFINLFLL